MFLFAQHALLEDGWADDVRLEIEDGRIKSLETGAASRSDDLKKPVILPAMHNLHSHAFQRAMAGLTEFRAGQSDSFWTWRSLMYRFLDRLTPEDVNAITAFAQMEMLQSGYASVGEFHYLHHGPHGQAYANVAEMADQIIKASRETGIGLTLLPVLYARGGADNRPLSGGQLRFCNTTESYVELVETTRKHLASAAQDSGFGIAPHSLRAVTPESLREIVAHFDNVPVHIHIAEQTAEIREIRDHTGARPVEWLFSNHAVDQRWCLVHATHMTPRETAQLAASKVVAGLCPVTEANLGDGIFDGAPYLDDGGRFGLGTDSNIRISLTGEIRMLEYSQRLKDRRRSVLAVEEGSVAEQIYQMAAKGGAQAIARDSGVIEPGKLADLVAIDTDDPSLAALPRKHLLDGVCFVAGDRCISDLWSAGRHVVRDGKHIEHHKITSRYLAVMKDLLNNI